ncbi:MULTISPECIES: Ig-like domain-containing protein [unclassified Streptomyces]|uniref:Ig-like domain-containing protein n=1 Tax=unclassified Streptomyces TaxID=2593676 RepID=UPI0037FE444A
MGTASPSAAADQSTTTLQVPSTTAAARAYVRLTATVTCTGTPSGGNGLGVTFFDGGDIMATVPVAADRRALYVAIFNTTGLHKITAAYNGNDNCFASHDEKTVTVTEAPYCPWGIGPCRDDHGFPYCPPRPSPPVINQLTGPRDQCRSW